MENPDAKKLGGEMGSDPSEVIRQWLASLPFKEQQILLGQWYVRRSENAAAVLRRVFDPDDIAAFHDKIAALADRLGQNFTREKSLLLGQLYLYMASAIPQDIRAQTLQLVKSMLGQPSRPSGSM
ncbi:MAG: hypothetical protein ABIG34_04520 [Candidatus Peregrinibacteria bacterium]